MGRQRRLKPPSANSSWKPASENENGENPHPQSALATDTAKAIATRTAEQLNAALVEVRGHVLHNL